MFGQQVDCFLPWFELEVRLSVWRVALVGTVAAVAVGILASANPVAAPAHVAVALRVAIITTLLVAGVYAQTSEVQLRMGALLVGAGMFSAVWLLNGSSVSILFAIGVLASGMAPLIFCSLMLAYPTGRLRSRAELRFLLITGVALAAPWTVMYLTSAQPAMRTPLLACVPHCQANPLQLGQAGVAFEGFLKAVASLGWIAMAVGTAFILVRRLRTVPAPARRSLLPNVLMAVLYAVSLLAFLLARGAGSPYVTMLGAMSVAPAFVIPLAMLVGFGVERLFMGAALAAFVNQLVATSDADPEGLMAQALDDPTLHIAYRRPATGRYVDGRGEPLAAPVEDSEHAVAWIGDASAPVAAVVFDRDLGDQKNFVQAAGAVAMLRLERSQLDAELAVSAGELAASRARILDATDAERQRIERDLHDGIQQHVVGLRLKLHLASEAVHNESGQGEQLLAALGSQMEGVLDELRSFARGVYPEILTDHGVGEALKSIARLGSIPVTVRTAGTGRYPAAIEIAVYFCCLEALQNVAKHAGPDTEAGVTLWQEQDRLCLQVRDNGRGFQMRERRWAHGLVHMRDRIEAVGGMLTVTSDPGRGTVVQGEVPITSPAPAHPAALPEAGS